MTPLPLGLAPALALLPTPRPRHRQPPPSLAASFHGAGGVSSCIGIDIWVEQHSRWRAAALGSGFRDDLVDGSGCSCPRRPHRSARTPARTDCRARHTRRACRVDVRDSAARRRTSLAPPTRLPLPLGLAPAASIRVGGGGALLVCRLGRKDCASLALKPAAAARCRRRCHSAAIQTGRSDRRTSVVSRGASSAVARRCTECSGRRLATCLHRSESLRASCLRHFSSQTTSKRLL